MHPRRAIPIFIALSMLAAVAQSPDDADSALRRTRERLLADLERLPRYTCVQTITRRYYRTRSDSTACSSLMTAHEKQKDKLPLSRWDRLRLEVAIVEGEDVFSWVGAPRFEKGTLEQLGGGGPLGSGDFGPFLHSIFNLASITFKGEMPASERRLLAYSYDMPAAASHYMVKTDTGWTATGYSGEFVIDPQADDIVSLTVRTAELPKSNPDCQAISEVDYERTEIHDRKILVPRETRLIAIVRNGSEIHNQTEYTSCREYAAKSRIVLEGLAGAGAAQPLTPGASPAVETTPSTAPPPVAGFPAGLHFHARIVTLIDSDTAAAGDPVELVLKSPIFGKNHAVLAPASARLHARLVGMEERGGFYFHISLQFESIELKGVAVPLRARADISNSIELSVFTVPIAVFPDLSKEDVTDMNFRKEHLHIDKFDWGWTTLALPAGDAGVNAR